MGGRGGGPVSGSCVSYRSTYLALCCLLLLLEGGRCCPSLQALLATSDSALLANNTHLRAIFREYAHGDAITSDGIERLLQQLGLGGDLNVGGRYGGASLQQHPENAHVTHDHNPEGTREGGGAGGDSTSSAFHGVNGSRRGGDTEDDGSNNTRQNMAETPHPTGVTSPPSDVAAGGGHDHDEDGYHHDHGEDGHDHGEDGHHHDHGEDGHHHDHGEDGHHHDHGEDSGHNHHPEESRLKAGGGSDPVHDLTRDGCGSVSGALSHLSLSAGSELRPSSLFASCPALLHYLLIQPAHCLLRWDGLKYQHYTSDGGGLGGGGPFKVQPVLDRRPAVPGGVTDPLIPAQPYRVDVHGHDLTIPRYDPRNPAFDPRGMPGYDPSRPGYDAKYPGYNPRNPGYDPGNVPKYDPRNPDYDPRGDHRGHDHDRRTRPRFYGSDGRSYHPTDRTSNREKDRNYKSRTHHFDSRRRGPDGKLLGVAGVDPDYDVYDNYHDEREDRDRRWDEKESIYARWVGGFVSMVLIGFISLGCTMVLPALRRTRHYDQANHFLLSLAVGTLAGDALIHLLPHAISMGAEHEFTHSDHNDHNLNLHEHEGSLHFKQALYGFTALMGIIIFLFLERLHNIRSGSKGHGHSHGTAARPQRGGSAAATLERNSSLPRNTSLLLSDTSLDVIGLPPSRKIGKKLSEHSKEDSFHNAAEADPGDPSRCFGGCPPQNRPNDANGNNDPTDGAPSLLDPGSAGNCLPSTLTRGGGTDSTNTTLRRDTVLPVRRQPLKDGSGRSVAATDLAERERLMSPLSVTEKLADQVMTEKSGSGHASSSRDDGGSVNIVLQEYHVSHHGHSHHGHAHVSGRKDSLRMMILMGEGMHIFMDGMAIGAAFATSLTGGIATAIAVLCHELPHKVGDFALLFDMGMTRRTALQMVTLMWLLSLGGMVIGELVGSIESASPWIYSFTAGIFLHLALVDLLSEVSVKDAESCSAAGQILLQVCGMLVGAGIMLVIALYEHDLHNLLSRAF